MAMTIAGGVVYTGKGCQFPCGTEASYALRLRTGHVLWTHPGNFGGQPVVVGSRVYQVWGETQTDTHVYDAADGRLLARIPRGGMWLGGAAGTFELTPAERGTPARLQRIAANGRPLWTVHLGSAVANPAPPVLAGGLVITQSDRFHPGIVAANARTGRIVWGADLGPTLAMAAAGSVLLVAQPGGLLSAVSLQNGSLLRRVRTDTTASDVLVDDSTVYVAGEPAVVALRP